jgi:hypothetical protein
VVAGACVGGGPPGECTARPADGAFRADLDPEVAAGVLWSAFVPWVLTELRRTRATAQIADALPAISLDGARARHRRPRFRRTG